MCAYAEGRTPERETCHHVGMRIAPFAVAMALLKEVVGDEIKGEDLPTVCVAREVEVNATFLAFCNGIWLMVEHYFEAATITGSEQRIEPGTTQVLPIISAYYLHSIYGTYNTIRK